MAGVWGGPAGPDVSPDDGAGGKQSATSPGPRLAALTNPVVIGAWLIAVTLATIVLGWPRP
jgi:hypothetical protein